MANIVAVHGKTFPVKDQLKKLGFQFRRTSGIAVRAGDDVVIDAGFSFDVPIFFIKTDDVDGIISRIDGFGLNVKVNGKSASPVADQPIPLPALAFLPDTDDHLFDGAPMHGIS